LRLQATCNNKKVYWLVLMSVALKTPKKSPKNQWISDWFTQSNTPRPASTSPATPGFKVSNWLFRYNPFFIILFQSKFGLLFPLLDHITSSFFRHLQQNKILTRQQVKKLLILLLLVLKFLQLTTSHISFFGRILPKLLPIYQVRNKIISIDTRGSP
jgi:hypothetical protein